MASLGHSGSQTSQLMHSSVMSRDMELPGASPTHARAPAEFLREARGNDGAHEAADIAAEARDLANDRRRHEKILLRRRQKKGFDLGIEVAVHSRHLELVLEIGHPAHA